MKTETSCGALVFTRTQQGNRYAIIHQTNGDWGFPKGHMEPGETEEATAKREIMEEVGLQVTLLPGFREELSYPLLRRPGYTKRCVYFLARYQGQQVRCQEAEVAETRLLTFEEATELLTFPASKELLQKAEAFLSRNTI